jgi:spore germination cell wall hydrolase CwlJ-like protein
MQELKNSWLIFIFILGISFPSFLSTPSKNRESGGIVVSEYYNKELLCLKSVLWHEARGEPEEGIRAVMSVIYNRKKAKGYPNTFCGVILQDKQFSAFNSDKSLATKPLKPVKGPDEEAYSKVAGIAQEAVVGAFEPVLEPSVLWYTHIRVKNKWTRKFERVKVIASHSFYKEI